MGGGKLSRQVTPEKLKKEIKAGLSVQEAAKKYKVTVRTVYNYLQYHKIRLNDAQDAVKRVAKPNRIYTIRKERNVTQKELSAILGISRQAIANHETSKRKVSEVMKVKYAEALSVTVADLFTEED